MVNGKKKMVLLESPAKIKTYQKYLGPEYIIKSTLGHLTNLKKEELSIDLNDNYKPNFSVIKGKNKIISELKSELKKCDLVYLASDDDREGEAIAWHTYDRLGLNNDNSKRIVTREITKTGILNAISNPKDIDLNMVNAQQARRVLDRLIGYLVTEILWKEIKSSYKKNKSLSAGRVQSVILKIIIENEKKISEFTEDNLYKSNGLFELNINNKNIILEADLNKEIKKKKNVNKLIEELEINKFFISNIITKKSNRKPPLPFITSTLQQEANSKLGISPQECNKILQRLYELGHITYMRTDSPTLSTEAIENIKIQVEKLFGNEYFQNNMENKKPKQKKKNTKKGEDLKQEAHEACRPTDFKKNTLSDFPNISYRENRLYKLIWERTIKSMMKPAVFDVTTVHIKLKDIDTKYYFISKKEFMNFAGYLKVDEYQKEHLRDPNHKEQENENKEKENILDLEDLKKIKKDMDIEMKSIQICEKFTKPPMRFNEASLIKKLDEMGIGRPSTFAMMVTNVQEREYIEKKNIPAIEKDSQVITLKNDNGNIEKDDKIEKIKINGENNKLISTKIGNIVFKFLEEHFSDIIDYNLTAYIETQLDEIAKGNTEWTIIVDEIYQKIKPKLDEFKENSSRYKDKFKRLLGNDPITNLEVYTYIGKYGPLVQLVSDDKNYNKFAPLKDIDIKDVSLEQALELLKFPKVLGEYKGKTMTLAKGQYGLYLKYGKKNISLKLEDNIGEDDVDLKFAKKYIKSIGTTNENTESLNVKYKGEKIEIKVGQYGPYFRYKNKNYSIYKTYDYKNLTEEDITKIISFKKKKK